MIERKKIMNKELEALERIKYYESQVIYRDKEIVNKDCCLIEIALKEKEKQDEILKILSKEPILVWYCSIYKDAYEMMSDAKGFMINEDPKTIERYFNLIKQWLEANKKTCRV